MQATFLIGNGFDLNLGMKTRYTDFYPRYCEMPCIRNRHQEIARFRALLKQEGSHPLWADFEKALGKYTDMPPLNQQWQLRSCLQDFKRQFANYLKAEEDRIDFDSCGAAMAGKFLSDLGSHLDYVEPRIRNAIQRSLLEDSLKSWSILDFNYTTILDRLLPYLSPDDLKYNSIEQIIHVHGTHSSGMIMGVDNITQVANPDVFETPLQQRLLLKPLLNQQSGPDNDYNASMCIERSSEICVFGMSLGETDKIWWQRVGQWLASHSRRQLLIFTRSRKMDPLFYEDILDYQNEVQELFFSRADIPQEQWDSLRNRVHIALNADIFHLEPLWLPLSRFL